ncbi:hypothetical protein BK816_05305 [Boudabousia tangfeifanii]|uniref:Uncharacterized protein n=1 Tax=Boudabousia tangfeifanii TaxID=1912795 RepID=A0A1D9MKA4_9ACTO|nr:hypothetical protein BK816_05305 [Boudabousia tangfeifanii]
MKAAMKVLGPVGTPRPGLLWAPVGGLRRHYESFSDLLAALLEEVTQATGVEALVGGGENLWLAFNAAKKSEVFLAKRDIAVVSEINLSGIPETGLWPSDIQSMDFFSQLAQMGIKTMADLKTIGSTALVNRFGYLGLLLWQIAIEDNDLYWGTTKTTEEEVRARVEFDYPVATTAAVMLASSRKINDFYRNMQRKGYVPKVLQMIATWDNQQVSKRNWLLPYQATSDEILERLQWQMEAWCQGDSGTLDRGSLRALEIVAKQSWQGELTSPLWGKNSASYVAMEQAIEKAKTLIGEDNICQLVLAGGPDPRNEVQMLPWGRGNQNETKKEVKKNDVWMGSLIGVGQWPSIVFTPPLKIALKSANGNEVLIDKGGNFNELPTKLEFSSEALKVISPWEDRAQIALQEEIEPWPVWGTWWEKMDPKLVLEKSMQGDRTPRGYCYLQSTLKVPVLLLFQHGKWFLEGVYCD